MTLPERADYSLTESALSPFSAEPAHGVFDAMMQEPLVRRNAEGNLERTGKVAHRESTFVRNVGKSEAAVQVFMKKFRRPFLLPRHQTSP